MAARDVATAAAVQVMSMADKGREEGVLVATITVPVNQTDGEVRLLGWSRGQGRGWGRPVFLLSWFAVKERWLMRWLANTAVQRFKCSERRRRLAVSWSVREGRISVILRVFNNCRL